MCVARVEEAQLCIAPYGERSSLWGECCLPKLCVLGVNTLGFGNAPALLIPFEIAAISFTCWPTCGKTGRRRWLQVAKGILCCLGKHWDSSLLCSLIILRSGSLAAEMMPPLSSPAWDEKNTLPLPAESLVSLHSTECSPLAVGTACLTVAAGRVLARAVLSGAAVPGSCILAGGWRSGLSMQIPGSFWPCLRPGRLFCSALQEMPLE